MELTVRLLPEIVPSTVALAFVIEMFAALTEILPADEKSFPALFREIELPVAVMFVKLETVIFVPDTCVMPPPAETIWKFVLEIFPSIVALLL